MQVFDDWLSDRYARISAKDFYRYIFPEGELQTKGEYTRGKYNALIVAVTNMKKADGHSKIKRYTMTDDLDAVDRATNSNDFCLCSPITYAGKNRTSENARFLYGIAVDVDKVIVRKRDNYPLGLANLMNRHVELMKRIPKPTFIVSSGSGLHLYYILEQPIPLFPDMVEELQAYKRELTRIIWDDTIVDIKHPREVQQEGIFQGFRMPDTVTKTGGRAKAFQTGERVTMEYMNQFVSSFYKAERAAAVKKKGKVTLAYAKEHYQDWYKRRIEEGQKRGTWNTNRAVYDWWKRTMLAGATVGHRYYCCMMLAVYAQKCSHYDAKHNPNPVTWEELEKDCLSMLEPMEQKTEDESNHFTSADILDALEAFNERFTTYPRKAIEFKTAILIPANKRKGQKQAEHLEEARAIRDIRSRRRGEAWNAHGGRKQKKEIVLEWRLVHPDGKKAECVRDTGLSKPTVYKWWDSDDEIREF